VVVADLPPIVHPKLAQASFGRAIRPLLDSPDLYAPLGVRLIQYHYPLLDCELQWQAQSRALLLRVNGTDFNYRPIGGQWIEPDGSALVAGANRAPSGYGFHPGGRPDGQPGGWFCFPGWAEWHNHNGHHRERAWASLRHDPAYAPLALILQLQTDLNKKDVGVT
jgi:hypothetical protein